MQQNSKACQKFTVLMFTFGALFLVIASFVIRKGEDVYFVNGNHSAMLDVLMAFVTKLGSGFLFVPLLIFMLFVRFKYAVLTIIVWIGHGLICVLLKRGPFSDLQRPRALLDNNLLHFVPNIDVHTYHSFPSGHTATMFCFALLLSLFSRNRIVSVGLFVLAVLVGYSRIYLLQHFLMDVAAGAIIGVVFTFLAWRYFETAELPVWMSKYLRLNARVSVTLAS